MLESVHKQKMALTAYATEHGGIAMLNSHQLEIVRKVILGLKPIEEVIWIISACISAVIPLVRILEKMLSKNDDDDVWFKNNEITNDGIIGMQI